MMCGLAGIILRDKQRTNDEYFDIMDIFTGLLVEAQSRGTDATGTVMFNRDGSHWLMKRPVMAEEYIRNDSYAQGLSLLDREVGCLIGHTRKSTRGTPRWNRNNHPIIAGNIIGTHNGTLYNYLELANQYGINRETGVDSEVLFRLIDQTSTPDIFAEEVLPGINGLVSAVWVDKEFPGYVYVLKGNKPLSLYYVESLGVIVYASLPEMIHRTVEQKKFKVDLDENVLARFNTQNLKLKKKSIKFNTQRPKYLTRYVPTQAGFWDEDDYTNGYSQRDIDRLKIHGIDINVG